VLDSEVASWVVVVVPSGVVVVVVAGAVVTGVVLS